MNPDEPLGKKSGVNTPKANGSFGSVLKGHGSSRKLHLESMIITEEDEDDIAFDDDPDLSKISKKEDDKVAIAEHFDAIQEVNEDLFGSEASLKNSSKKLPSNTSPTKPFPKSLFSRNEVLSPKENDMMQ